MTRGRDAWSFLLLFGSETGQAAAITEEIEQKAHLHGLTGVRHCFSTTEKKFWLERETCVVIVVSTTGDGEPPETTQKFMRRIQKKTHPSNLLAQLNFSILGLGDSNYTNFCNCSKTMNARLLELGARHFHPPAWADDAVGLDVVADPWMDALWPALRRHLGVTSPDAAGEGRPPLTAMPITRKLTPANGDALATQSAGQLAGDGDTCADRQIPSNEVAQMSSPAPTMDEPNLVKTTLNGSEQTRHNTTMSGGASLSDLSLQSSNHIPNGDNLDDSNHDSAFDSSVDSVDVPVECLSQSLPPLSECALSVPALPKPCIEIAYVSESCDLASLSFQHGCPLPSAASPLSLVTLTKVTQLTRSDAVKTAHKLEVDVSSCEWTYQPGDSVGVVCENAWGEVDSLVTRVGMASVADRTYELGVSPGARKSSLPPHLPPRATLRHALTACCDVRAAPKKALLRALAAHTSHPREQRRLLELCSKQGAQQYTRYIRTPGLSLLDILHAFSSCQPPASTLLELLPRLLPRPYSAASCPATHLRRLHLVYNIVHVPAGDGRLHASMGVCTGWLEKLTRCLRPASDDASLRHGVASLALESGQCDASSGEGERVSIDERVADCESPSHGDSAPVRLRMYLRSSTCFHPPPCVSYPVLMIGPGTGVAPFIGFLQQREHILQAIPDGSAENSPPGLCLLYYGCRHRERDFLFRNELRGFESRGTLTHLSVSFSRDGGPGPRYVQDSLRLEAERVAGVLSAPEGRVYVCGDAAGMALDVRTALAQILAQEHGMSEQDAESHLMRMRLHKRYLEDVWT